MPLPRALIVTITLLPVLMCACVEPPASSVTPRVTPDMPASQDRDAEMTPDAQRQDMRDSSPDLRAEEDMDDATQDLQDTSDISLDASTMDADMMSPPDLAPPRYGELMCGESIEAATMLFEGTIALGTPFIIQTDRLKTVFTSAPVMSISPTRSVTLSPAVSCGSHCRRREFTIAQANTYTLTITNSDLDKTLQTCTISF